MIQYFLINLIMGNYCCADDCPLPKEQYKLKRKPTLNDPEVKMEYEKKICKILNKALAKFKQGREYSGMLIKGELGKGGQGSVFLVELSHINKNGDLVKQNYAMKRVPKEKLKAERTKKALLLENQILSTNGSKFLAQIQYAFQDSGYLYYVMEAAKGGDLFSYVYKRPQQIQGKVDSFRKLGENGIKFIIAGVILGIQYLNTRGIIYRDLKPENVLIFEDGYPKIADFGISHQLKEQPLCYDVKGTSIYFSPQMWHQKGYNRGHDLWTLGVFIYELIFKAIPFSSSTVQSKNFYRSAKKWQRNPIFGDQAASGELLDLIQCLLKVDPQQRLGYQSFDELKGHKFLKDFDWQKYQTKTMESPLIHIIEAHPAKFPQSTEEVVLVNEARQTHEKIPFTFVRDEFTRANTGDKNNQSQSSQSL